MSTEPNWIFEHILEHPRGKRSSVMVLLPASHAKSSLATNPTDEVKLLENPENNDIPRIGYQDCVGEHRRVNYTGR